MSAAIGKRILKWTILIVPWVIVLALSIGWGLSAWTPGYLEGLVPKLAADMGLPLEEFHVRDAGLFSADIGPVRLGSVEDGLRLNNVHVTYTPASLNSGKVNQVILDGVSLNCVYDGQSFTVPILKLLPSSNGDSSTLPDLPFEKLIIKDSILICDVDGKSFSIPFSATITPGKTIDFSGSLRPRDQEIHLKGKLGPAPDNLTIELTAKGFQLGAFADLMPTPVGGELDLDLTAQLDLSKPDRLTSTMNMVVKNIDLSKFGVVLEDKIPLSAHATITDSVLSFSLAPLSLAAPYPMNITITEGQASSNSIATNFSITAAGVTLPGNFKADRQGDLWDISLSAANPDALTINTDGRTIHLAGLDFSAKGTAGPDIADIVVNATTRGTRIGKTGVRSGAVNITLPLAWPAPKRYTSGKLKISGMRYDKYKLGIVSANLRQESMGLAFGGTLFTDILPGLQVPFSGHASMKSNEATLQFDINKYKLPENFDPSNLTPTLKDMKLSGYLTAEGGMNISKSGIESRLGIFFTDGSLDIGEQGTSLSGIRLFFESPDLLNFRSAPAQMFAFDTLSTGGIEIENGVVTFQLEPRGVILVERMKFDWCDGHVASRAFRVVPGRNEYDVTLFCSQLRLSDILAQLGIAKAKGEATLSGELPVTWKNGKISFNNGFLHSTPGERGIIQIEAMDDLLAAIPKGTPQRGQLELAQAAIRDFEYKWIRIKADTVGEELLVRLSLDGKPVGTLPFIYTKEFGGFIKVTGDVKGSNFQGLKLDVNFSLPLDRILLYKDVIDMIE